MNTEPEKTQEDLPRWQAIGCGVLFALPFLAAGLYIMGISFGWLPADPEAFIAPRGIVGLAGVFFVVGGLMALLHGVGGRAGQKNIVFRALNSLLGFAFLLLLGLVFTGAGFGPGDDRAVEGGMSLGPLPISGGLGGRGLFGIIGLLILLVMSVGLVSATYAGLKTVYHKIRADFTSDSGQTEQE